MYLYVETNAKMFLASMKWVMIIIAALPVKWMAPESIFEKIYTSKSDV